MRVLAYCLRIALAAYVVALIALYFMQDGMLLPATQAAEAPTGRHAGYDVQTWQVDGHYAGYLATPDTAQPRGTVIVYHGNEESAETKLPVAETFLRAGYRAVIVEYPGHGKRGGERTMKAALQASRDAFAAARAQWPGPLYLCGESLGAGMAAQVVRGHEASIAGVVLITPWDTLASVAGEKYPIFPVRWMLHDPFDSIGALAHYTGPLVVIGAQQDTLIPVGHATHLASAHPGAQLLLLPESNHDTWPDGMTEPRWQQVLAWLHAN
jgi:uncharacterized protein